MVSVLSCTEDGQTAGSSKESGTTSCFPEKEEWTGSGISQAFVEVFVSGNKSCLYGYDVPDTSIYQKDHWTGIPGSDPTILYLYVLDFLGIKFNSCFYLE